jgi:RNA polymerase sigma-70 factor, ECF subfamily
MSSPSQLFYDHLPESLRRQVSSPAELEVPLQDLWQRAQSAWPQLKVPRDKFLAFVVERLPAGKALSDIWPSLHGNDLYLTCACALGQDKAVLLFEEMYFPSIDGALRQLEIPLETKKEIKQHLRHVLFIVSKKSRPKICEYSGLGSLKRWLSAVAFREALHLLKPKRSVTATRESFWETLYDPDDDLELAFIKKQYRLEFKQSLRQAVDKLSARERTLLKLQFSERLGIDGIAQIYRIHRATAARWLVKARQSLLSEVKQIFLSRLQVSSKQANSIMQLIESNLELSLSRLLNAYGDKRR